MKPFTRGPLSAEARRFRYTLAIECFGLQAEVSYNQRRLERAILSSLPPCSRRVATVSEEALCFEALAGRPRGWSLTRQGQSYGDCLTLGQMTENLRSALEIAVSRRPGDYLFVHAAVCSWKGRAVVLPGKSMAGKTTLISELCRRGAEYMSDEFAVLGPDEHVYPFPRPLSIRNRKGNAVPVSAESLGLRTSKQPVPLGLLVFSEWKAGSAWRPVRPSAGETFLATLAHVVLAQSLSPEWFTRLAKMTARTVSMQGERGDAGEVADDVLRALDL